MLFVVVCCCVVVVVFVVNGDGGVGVGEKYWSVGVLYVRSGVFCLTVGCFAGI